MHTFSLFVKRLFDIVSSVLAIVLLIVIPVLIIIPIAIRVTSKGPAVFVQERIGKDGKPFRIYKFRTMRIPEDSFDCDGNALENYDRITPVGAFLRKTSLDELMQLFNVANGTMSVIGPRPTLGYQVEKYDEFQRKRLLMKPGITGLAQVNGRNELTWEEKIQFDVTYVEHFSLWLDIKILLKTVLVVFKKDGVEFTKADALSMETPAQSTEKEIRFK